MRFTITLPKTTREQVVYELMLHEYGGRGLEIISCAIEARASNRHKWRRTGFWSSHANRHSLRSIPFDQRLPRPDLCASQLELIRAELIKQLPQISVAADPSVTDF